LAHINAVVVTSIQVVNEMHSTPEAAAPHIQKLVSRC
jgi:hypothetical protein